MSTGYIFPYKNSPVWGKTPAERNRQWKAEWEGLDRADAN